MEEKRMSEEQDLTPEEIEEQRRFEEQQREEYLASLDPDDPSELLKVIEREHLDGILVDDFVNSWVRFLDHLTDAHWLIKEITALFLISTITFNRWTFLDLSRATAIMDDEPDNLIGGFFFNLWIIILGKSRIARKTTVIRLVKQMMRKISYTLYVPTGDGDETEAINMLLPHEFNPASFVFEMQQHDVDGYCYASWVDDEVSRFYEQMASATYMAGIAPALSRLYEPLDDYVRSTIARGRESIDRSYLTILTASTFHLPQHFTEAEIMQGFLNRFMFILDVLEEREDRLDPMITGYKISSEMKKMTDWLIAVRDAGTVSIYLFPNSVEKKYYDVMSFIRDMWGICLIS
jgi:hypothetical protein